MPPPKTLSALKRKLLSALNTSSVAHPRVGRLRAELGFNFADSFMETALDLGNSFNLTQVTGLIEVLEVGAQFQQELLGKTVTHRKSILHINRGKCKITRFSSTDPVLFLVTREQVPMIVSLYLPRLRTPAMPFPHRLNSDGTIDSICNHCFATVATSTTESDLEQSEASHVCEPARVAYYHHFDPTARRPPVNDPNDQPAADIPAINNR